MARQRQILNPNSNTPEDHNYQQQARRQSQLYGVMFLAGIVAVISLAIYFFVFNADQPLPELNPDFDVDAVVDNSVSYEMIGREHLPDAQNPMDYNSNPPTSGAHNNFWVTPIGVFTETLSDTMLIHNLEHGHVWLSYRDEGDEDAIALLSLVQQEYPDRTIVTYRPDNDARISAAAWTQLLELENLDADQLEAFIVRYSDQAPESIMER